MLKKLGATPLFTSGVPLLGGPYNAPAKTTEVKPFHPFKDKQHSFPIYCNYIVLSKLLCMLGSTTNIIRLNLKLDAWSHQSNSNRIDSIYSHLLLDFCELSSSLYSKPWPFLTLLPLHLKIDGYMNVKGFLPGPVRPCNHMNWLQGSAKQS